MPEAKKRTPVRSSARRASQRLVVSVDLAEKALRDLMTEQCRTDSGGYLTVYRGSRPALVAAGVPEHAFSADGTRRAFQLQTVNVCCTGGYELLKGTTQLAGDAWELEVDWGFVRPYMQAAHPAVQELARMLLKDVCAWAAPGARIDRDSTPAAIIERLAADPRASDFKPRPDAPRFQVTPEFQRLLREQASKLFELVHTNCEVFPEQVEAAPVQPTRPALRVVAGGA